MSIVNVSNTTWHGHSTISLLTIIIIYNINNNFNNNNNNSNNNGNNNNDNVKYSRCAHTSSLG